MKNVFGRTEKDWYLKDLKQGQRIEYTIDNGENILQGTICGIATNGTVLVGKTYIVKPDIAIDKEVYDYSHIVLPEIFINPIDLSNDVKIEKANEMFSTTDIELLKSRGFQKDDSKHSGYYHLIDERYTYVLIPKEDTTFKLEIYETFYDGEESYLAELCVLHGNKDQSLEDFLNHEFVDQ